MPLFPKQTQSFRNQKQSFVNATPKCQKKGKGQILRGVNQGDSPFCISWRKAKPCLKFLKRKQNSLQSRIDLGLVLFYSASFFFLYLLRYSSYLRCRYIPKITPPFTAPGSGSPTYADVHRRSLEDISVLAATSVVFLLNDLQLAKIIENRQTFLMLACLT